MNFGSKVSVVRPELYAITSCDTTSFKFNIEKVYVFKKVCDYPSSLTLINPILPCVAYLYPQKTSKILKVF